MKILAVETSCDETSIALVEAKGGLKSPQFKVIKNLVASQIKIHQPFGGVVPNLAKREHIKNLPLILKKLQAAGHRLKDVDLIAVTVGPGLEPALWTGINFADELAKEYKKQIVGASHLDGHLYSLLLQQKSTDFKKTFPAIALIISGGHTILALMKNLKDARKIGETRDDAVGEAFDKAARLLELPYPGGPEIEKLAKKGDPDAVKFPRPMLDQKNFDFSFSGLKTSVLYHLRDNKNAQKADVAASFQRAAFDVLIKKTLRAAKESGAKSIMVSGGVAANKTLRQEFKKTLKKEFKSQAMPKLFITKFPTDNAAMIAAAAYINYLKKKKYKIVANGNLNI